MLPILWALVVLPFFANGWVNARVAAAPAWYWTFELCTWVVLPLAAHAVARRQGGPSFEVLGFHLALGGRRDAWRLLAACLAGALLGPLVYAAAAAAAATGFGDGGYFSYADVVPAGGLARVVVVLWFALSAAFVEETLYRGYGWQLCRAAPRPRVAYLIVSSVVFALVHWEGGLAGVAAAWIYGVAAALAYLALRNLWPLVTAHAATDLFAFG